MKKYAIFVFLFFAALMLNDNVEAKEIKEYCVTGSFSKHKDDYVFKVEILSDSSYQLENMVSVNNDKSYVVVDIEESVFNEYFSFGEKYTFVINDDDKNGRYEIKNLGEKHCYLRWDNYGDYIGKVSGYFEKECEEISFHNEYFEETSVYKFVIVSSDNDEIKNKDYVYMVYEKEYFKEKLGYNNSYSISLFDTGEVYDECGLYSMFSPEFLRYFTFGFEVYDKNEMISDAKEEKQEEIKESFKPMIIVVTLVVLSGTIYSIAQKKWLDKKR